MNNVILSLVFTNDKRKNNTYYFTVKTASTQPWARDKKKLRSLCLRRGCFHVERRADIVTFVVTLVFPLLVKTKFNWRVLHTNYNKMVKIALRKSDLFLAKTVCELILKKAGLRNSNIHRSNTLGHLFDDYRNYKYCNFLHLKISNYKSWKKKCLNSIKNNAYSFNKIFSPDRIDYF